MRLLVCRWGCSCGREGDGWIYIPRARGMLFERVERRRVARAALLLCDGDKGTCGAPAVCGRAVRGRIRCDMV